MTDSRLPEPPKVELEVVSERRVGEGGFLLIRRMSVVAKREARRSQPFSYDALDRAALDAAIIVAHHTDERGRVCVWLRTCLRPPLAVRPIPPFHSGSLWEVPAGLVEPGEAPVAAAARETAEELGFHVKEADMAPLGPSTVPAPGFIGELHHWFHVKVDPATRVEPEGDGSPLESEALIVAVPLDEAIAACKRGDVPDAKTELGLRRLADHFG